MKVKAAIQGCAAATTTAGRDSWATTSGGKPSVAAGAAGAAKHTVVQKRSSAGNQASGAADVTGAGEPRVVVLLAHNPLVTNVVLDLEAEDAGIRRAAKVVLAGHTHAGQMYCYAPLSYLMAPYYWGLYEGVTARLQVYVGPGAHFWGPPMKMAGMMQIPVVTLRVAR